MAATDNAPQNVGLVPRRRATPPASGVVMIDGVGHIASAYPAWSRTAAIIQNIDPAMKISGWLGAEAWRHQIWTIGDLVDAALNGAVTDEPRGRKGGGFRVME